MRTLSEAQSDYTAARNAYLDAIKAESLSQSNGTATKSMSRPASKDLYEQMMAYAVEVSRLSGKPLLSSTGRTAPLSRTATTRTGAPAQSRPALSPTGDRRSSTRPKPSPMSASASLSGPSTLPTTIPTGQASLTPSATRSSAQALPRIPSSIPWPFPSTKTPSGTSSGRSGPSMPGGRSSPTWAAASPSAGCNTWPCGR